MNAYAIPVRMRCSGLCALHCPGHEDTIELSARDASALLDWLRDARAGTFIPRSSSRLAIEDPGNGGLIIRVQPWPPE